MYDQSTDLILHTDFATRERYVVLTNEDADIIFNRSFFAAHARATYLNAARTEQAHWKADALGHNSYAETTRYRLYVARLAQNTMNKKAIY